MLSCSRRNKKNAKYCNEVLQIKNKFVHLQPQNALERCRSGRSGRTRNAVYGQLYRGFESLPFRQRAVAILLFFLCEKGEIRQSVAFRVTCLRLVVVCCANRCACRTNAPENDFSSHCSTTPTISDCNNLPSVTSQLRRPFESHLWLCVVK